MIKVMFVCHGNICRSPMAEFIFKDMVKKRHLEDKIYVESSATSREEIGARVHYGTAKILDEMGIDYSKKRARQFTRKDYEDFDNIVVMDDNKIINLRYIVEDKDDKVKKLLEYAGIDRDVADPWYTHNFTKTYEDITLGCACLLDNIVNLM